MYLSCPEDFSPNFARREFYNLLIESSCPGIDQIALHFSTFFIWTTPDEFFHLLRCCQRSNLLNKGPGLSFNHTCNLHCSMRKLRFDINKNLFTSKFHECSKCVVTKTLLSIKLKNKPFFIKTKLNFHILFQSKT